MSSKSLGTTQSPLWSICREHCASVAHRDPSRGPTHCRPDTTPAQPAAAPPAKPSREPSGDGKRSGVGGRTRGRGWTQLRLINPKILCGRMAAIDAAMYDQFAQDLAPIARPAEQSASHLCRILAPINFSQPSPRNPRALAETFPFSPGRPFSSGSFQRPDSGRDLVARSCWKRLVTDQIFTKRSTTTITII